MFNYFFLTSTLNVDNFFVIIINKKKCLCKLLYCEVYKVNIKLSLYDKQGCYLTWKTWNLTTQAKNLGFDKFRNKTWYFEQKPGISNNFNMYSSKILI